MGKVDDVFKIGDIVRCIDTVVFMDHVVFKKRSRHHKGQLLLVTKADHAYFNVMHKNYELISRAQDTVLA